MDRRAVVLQKGAPPARPRVAWDYVQKCCEKPRRRENERRNEEPWLQRPWFRTLQTCEKYLFLRKLIRLSPVSNSVQYDIPVKDVIAQPVVSRPDAPLSLSRFQARQLFDIVPTRLVIRVLCKDIEKPVENAQKPGIAPGNASCISLKGRCGERSIGGRHESETPTLL